MFVNGEIAQFIQNQQRGCKVLFEFRLEAVRRLGCGQGVNGINGGGEEDRLTGKTGGIAERCGKMGLALM